MKKILLSVCLSLGICFALPYNNVSANNDAISFSVFNTEEKQNFQMDSEYEVLLEEINIASKAKSQTYKLNKLMQLKTEYIEKLYYYKTLNIDQLKLMNYTDEQIEAIKSFDGSDELATKASAYVYVSAATLSKTSTLHGVRFSWHWMGTPFFSGPGVTDGVSVRWQSSNPSAEEITTNVHTNTKVYVKYDNNKIYQTIKKDNVARYAEAKFSLNGSNGQGGVGIALSGVFDIYVTLPSGTSAIIAHTNYRFVYAHSTLSFGGLSFSYPSGISIDVTGGTIESTKNWETY